MCGIAGIVDLAGRKLERDPRLQRMLHAVRHRGPDDQGVSVRAHVAVGCQRLHIVGSGGPNQPVVNEDDSIIAVVNGEFFDHVSIRQDLERRGHRFRTDTDAEIVVHLWEEHQLDMLSSLQGQFALALYDQNLRQLVLARDRVGICPLYWAQRGDQFVYCSEIKGLLAALDERPPPDIFGIDQIFSFFSLPTTRTCFENVFAVAPGSCLTLNVAAAANKPATPTVQRYWDIRFPEWGAEFDAPQRDVVDGFGEVFDKAVARRLTSQPPLVSYLSGGVDSTLLRQRANRLAGSVIPCYSADVTASSAKAHHRPYFSEHQAARRAAAATGGQQSMVDCAGEDLAGVYPELLQAAESPVIDTAAAASFLLARQVKRDGFKVVISGEGADEALAGYAWHKINRLMNSIDSRGFRPSNWLRYVVAKRMQPGIPWSLSKHVQRLTGGPYGQLDLFGFLALARHLFYSDEMLDRLGDYLPHRELDVPADLNRWHPLNRSLYYSYKIMLPGMLLSHKSDRPAMRHAVETRFPYLDHEFVDYCARLHPRWKLRGLLRDKYVLRKFAARHLPQELAYRRKKMFRAPWIDLFLNSESSRFQEYLSRPSLEQTGWFDFARVHRWLNKYRQGRLLPGRKFLVSYGLTVVLTTQMWHRQFFAT